jgi:uncharacterized protein (DUF2249 family)
MTKPRSSVADAISAHHRELGAHLAAEVAALEQETSDGSGLVAFLTGELLPHAAGEERRLYPVVNRLIPEHGTPTATMTLDHEYIEAAARQIAELARQLQSAGDEATRVSTRRALTRAAVQLEAVVRLHTSKEERAYLPLVARNLSVAEQERLLDDLHETATVVGAGHLDAGVGADPVPPALDVRPLPPAQRHALIFCTFDALEPGADFILINDHDPKPLYYQLSIERRGQLAWEYVEQGPDEWRVRIGKLEGIDAAPTEAPTV